MESQEENKESLDISKLIRKTGKGCTLSTKYSSSSIGVHDDNDAYSSEVLETIIKGSKRERGLSLLKKRIFANRSSSVNKQEVIKKVRQRSSSFGLAEETIKSSKAEDECFLSAEELRKVLDRSSCSKQHNVDYQKEIRRRSIELFSNAKLDFSSPESVHEVKDSKPILSTPNAKSGKSYLKEIFSSTKKNALEIPKKDSVQVFEGRLQKSFLSPNPKENNSAEGEQAFTEEEQGTNVNNLNYFHREGKQTEEEVLLNLFPDSPPNHRSSSSSANSLFSFNLSTPADSEDIFSISKTHTPFSPMAATVSSPIESEEGIVVRLSVKPWVRKLATKLLVWFLKGLWVLVRLLLVVLFIDNVVPKLRFELQVARFGMPIVEYPM